MKFLKVIVVILILIFGGLIYLSYQLNANATTLNSEQINYTIESGKSANGVIHDLAEKGIVSNETFFKLHSKIKKYNLNFKAGTYEVQPEMSTAHLIEMFNKGVKDTDFITLKILNGWTTDKAVEEIYSVTGVSKEELIAYMKDNKDNYWFTADLEVNEHILDGILYPDTYQLSKNTNATQVMKKVLSNLDKKLEPYKVELQSSQYSLLELFTMASMIEREALHDEDRPKIAQIIYNRLATDMKLQIDATVLAVVGWKDTVTYEDLKVDSPYNTYKYKGLPPTPIAMPSITSIVATVTPEEHDYIYYVADRKTGYHHFAKTFEEHQDNIEKYWKVKE